MSLTAALILDAIRAKHTDAAIVPELTISDLDWLELCEPGTRMPPERRIDALMIRTFQRTAIEIKTTRSDFARDDWYKRRPWARVVHRFVFAVPHDLDVMAPHGCGLWKVAPDGRITVAKKAIVQKHPEHLPQEVIQRLAHRASGAHRFEGDET
ncbi:hypothetical protein [Nesterenkonia suensis]